MATSGLIWGMGKVKLAENLQSLGLKRSKCVAPAYVTKHMLVVWAHDTQEFAENTTARSMPALGVQSSMA